MKTKSKALTRTQLRTRAMNLLKSGRYYNYIGTAEPVSNSKYQPGDTVVSIDPAKQRDHALTLVKTIRWNGGGGYLVLNRYGRPFTTTNIRKLSETPKRIKNRLTRVDA
tara:strand:+ start:729 stop:1055 length:327 start_codon:yes stop_codon:yes gene_type:complete